MFNKQMFKQAQELVTANSAQLLTGTGVVGVFTTAILAARAGYKHAELVQTEKDDINSVAEEVEGAIALEDLKWSKRDWALTLGQVYAPPVVTGLTTAAAIVTGYQVMSKRSAALALGYGLSEKAFAEYRQKVTETLTAKKKDEVESAVAQGTVERAESKMRPIVLSEGLVLCVDHFSGQPFQSSIETIRKAENDLNDEIGEYGVGRLNDFYEKVGLPTPDIFHSFCWNQTNRCEVDYSHTELDKSGRPVLVMQFVHAPRPTYDGMDRYV